MNTVDKGCSETKVRKEKTKKKTLVIMANLTPDDRDVKRRKTSSDTYVVDIYPEQKTLIHVPLVPTDIWTTGAYPDPIIFINYIFN